MNWLKKFPRNLLECLHHRYVLPATLLFLLLSGSSAAALYTHSDAYQSATYATTPVPIIVKKVSSPQISPKTTTEAAPVPNPTNTAPATTQAQHSPPISKAQSFAATQQTIGCNDKVNSIYYNYNMGLTAENQHHKDELDSIQTAYSYGFYTSLASELNDGSTAEQLRDEAITDENTRYNAATLKLSSDEDAQMKATGCFGPR